MNGHFGSVSSVLNGTTGDGNGEVLHMMGLAVLHIIDVAYLRRSPLHSVHARRANQGA